MLPRFVRAVFDDSRRGDDRAGAVRAGAALRGKPPILRRQTINLIAILGITVILYGTVVPFEIGQGNPLNWGLTWQPPASGDTLANVLIYVPIGAFLRLIFRRRASFRVPEVLLSLLVAGGLSYLTEVAQTVISSRVPSWMDVTCNLVGAMIGVALAPLFQRGLRNLHAFLYFKLRREPFAAAAAATLACVCTYALTPPDIHPAPGHVARAVQALRAVPEAWLWGAGAGQNGALSPAQVMDKIVAAGSYGFLAFVLVLAAREARRSPLASAWYAFSRSAALAVVIEAVQLFTISHVADVRDLASAWVWCGLASVVGWGLVHRWPGMHQRPAAVLRDLVVVVALVLIAWGVGSVMLKNTSSEPVSVVWLPMVDNFHRSWNGLLGEYTSGALQFSLVAGLLVLWYRSHRQPPRRLVIVGGTLATAIVAGAAAVYRHHTFDTAQLLLALLAAAAVVRLDRAVFGRTKPAASLLTV